MGEDDILFHTGNPIAVRILLAGLGLGIVALPGWDLRPWTIPLPLGLGFWAITLGAFSLGALLISGAFLPQAAVHAHPDGLELRWRTRRGDRRVILPAERLGAPEVRRFDPEDGPDTFYVHIPRKGRLRRPLSSPQFVAEADAEALADRIRAALGVSGADR